MSKSSSVTGSDVTRSSLKLLERAVDDFFEQLGEPRPAPTELADSSAQARRQRRIVWPSWPR